MRTDQSKEKEGPETNVCRRGSGWIRFAGCLGIVKMGTQPAVEPAQECAVFRGAETSLPRIHSE